MFDIQNHRDPVPCGWEDMPQRRKFAVRAVAVDKERLAGRRSNRWRDRQLVVAFKRRRGKLWQVPVFVCVLWFVVAVLFFFWN